MYCSYCGSYVCEGDAFCANCGSRLNRNHLVEQNKLHNITGKLLSMACFAVLICVIAYGVALGVVNMVGIPSGDYCSVPVTDWQSLTSAINKGALGDTKVYMLTFSVDWFRKNLEIDIYSANDILDNPMKYEISGDIMHVWTDPEYVDTYEVMNIDEYFSFSKGNRRLYLGDMCFYRCNY